MCTLQPPRPLDPRAIKTLIAALEYVLETTTNNPDPGVLLTRVECTRVLNILKEQELAR